jgi:hypothetical protein
MAFDRQKLAIGQQRAQFLATRLHMHRAIKPDPHHLGDTAGIVAIGLVICAFNTARICRVSTQIAGMSASSVGRGDHV